MEKWIIIGICIYLVVLILFLIINKRYWDFYYEVYPEDLKLTRKEEYLYLKRKCANKNYKRQKKLLKKEKNKK